ncbi:MAG: rod shape-determining protein MreC [Nitrospira sp.]|nr:rod shape-determining protein MreC [Nitrospira sp.]
MPKKKILLLLLIVVALGMMTYQGSREKLQPLKFLTNAFNGFNTLMNSLKDTATAPFNRMLLREKENISLKKEVNQLHQENQKLQEAMRENKRLRELLSLKQQDPGYVTAARIISKVPDHWSKTLVLDKGLTDGVKKDMTAITPRGLVGKITEASQSYSYLLLLTDINFSVAVRLQETRKEGLLSGTGPRKCKLKYIPHEEEVKVGDTVITSGMDALFPKGIPVGYVSGVDKKSAGFFQDIEVIPFEDTTRTEEVAIIKR